MVMMAHLSLKFNSFPIFAALLCVSLAFPSASQPSKPKTNKDSCLKVSDQVDQQAIKQEALDEYLGANNNFTVNLFHKLYHAPLSDAIDDQVNLIFSPHSVWQAVVLSYLLSSGDMAAMLERSMGVGNIGKLNVMKAYKTLKFFDQVVSEAKVEIGPGEGPVGPLADQKLYQLDTANRVYFEASLSKYLNQETLKLLNDEIHIADFRSRSQETRAEINQWISDVTRGKIQEMLSPDTISPATIMVLANAAYFKGKWLNPFKKSDTEPAAFILDNANRDMITVPTMKLTDTFLPVGVSETLRAAVVELPYASGDGNDLSMYLIAPVSADGWNLDAVLERLTAKTLKEARDSVVRKEITLLTVPKFKIETTFDLLGPLNSLGLGAMFVPSKADFGCLSANLTGTAFSLAEHRAVIEVNEEGTEAAAATAFIAFRSGRIGPTEIKINRPFLYVLYDKDPDTVLFMGVVRNPLLG